MTCVDIVLTKDIDDPHDTKEPLPTDHYGYMVPLTKEEMTKEPRLHEGGMRGSRGRGGRFRGSRGGDHRGNYRGGDFRGGDFRGRGGMRPHRFNDDDDIDMPR